MGSAQWICPGLGWEYLSLRDLGGLELERGSEATLRWPGSLKMVADTGLEYDYLSTREMELDFQIHSMPIFPHLLKKGKGDVLLFRVRLERSLSIFFLIPGLSRRCWLGEGEVVLPLEP